ncbi:DUF397 domain-containing protein [Kitasatospora sp. NPDC051984]|uniref:DUF397 domain-containing protein n=1 Tax=Kitasatospora sp. NPDC051984 TaxID=3364059 RepID=UPI0037C67678
MAYLANASAMPVTWTKASASGGNGDCVELARHGGTVAVRDSKNPDGPAHVHRPGAVGAFLAAVAAGQLVPVV